MGEMRVLTRKGDERLEWDPKDKKATAAAKAEFDRLKGEGYLFYEVTETRGKPVEKFSAKLGKILAAPGAATKADKVSGARAAAMRGGPTAQARPFR